MQESIQWKLVSRFLSHDAGQEVKMPSATDIITYIGVPLAVAGVLPILSVVLKTFIFSLHVSIQTQVKPELLDCTRRRSSCQCGPPA
jgi:hypothetical protein